MSEGALRDMRQQSSRSRAHPKTRLEFRRGRLPLSSRPRLLCGAIAYHVVSLPKCENQDANIAETYQYNKLLEFGGVVSTDNTARLQHEDHSLEVLD